MGINETQGYKGYNPYNKLRVALRTDSDGSVNVSVFTKNMARYWCYEVRIYQDSVIDRGSERLHERTESEQLLCQTLVEHARTIYGHLQAMKLGGAK